MKPTSSQTKHKEIPETVELSSDICSISSVW